MGGLTPGQFAGWLIVFPRGCHFVCREDGEALARKTAAAVGGTILRLVRDPIVRVGDPPP